MNETPVRTSFLFAFTTMLALAAALPCQQEAPPAKDPPKLSEWPELKETDKDRVMSLIAQFRKDDEQLRESASSQLKALGVGAIPLMFIQVSDRPGNVNGYLFALFDSMLDREHAALMARESKKPKVELRRYLMRRLCAFNDPEMLPVLKAATKDSDARTAFYAQIGELGLGDRTHLAAVLDYSKLNWKDEGALVAVVLPAARSHEAGDAVFEAIAKAPAADQMAGLRLVRYLATKEQSMLLKRYLGSPDHTVKKEAINAARVLHGEEPIEDLTVFQAIELSKQWLTKL
jgi:hypothetical protein